MNNVVLIGRLVNAVDYRMKGENEFCRFTLAIDRGLSKEKKEEAESKGQPTADFINVVVWGKLAGNCRKFLRKGKLVGVQGKIQTGSYVGQDGIKRYSVNVLADVVKFIEFADEKEEKPFRDFDTGDDFDLPFKDTDEDIPF